MGFSVSGSAAIVFAAMFIAFGSFHTATVNGFESVSDAQSDRTDRTLDRQNTAIELDAATYDPDASGGTLTVRVNNTGTTDLAVDAVDLLGDNEYLIPNATSVDGDGSTGLWLPGERLTLVRDGLGSDPGRVKVVTGPGVAAAAPTEAI